MSAASTIGCSRRARTSSAPRSASSSVRSRRRLLRRPLEAYTKLLKFKDFPERGLHPAFSEDCRRIRHKPLVRRGFPLFPVVSAQQTDSLASRNEGGPVRVVAPGPIFFLHS